MTMDKFRASLLAAKTGQEMWEIISQQENQL